MVDHPPIYDISYLVISDSVLVPWSTYDSCWLVKILKKSYKERWFSVQETVEGAMVDHRHYRCKYCYHKIAPMKAPARSERAIISCVSWPYRGTSWLVTVPVVRYLPGTWYLPTLGRALYELYTNCLFFFFFRSNTKQSEGRFRLYSSIVFPKRTVFTGSWVERHRVDCRGVKSTRQKQDVIHDIQSFFPSLIFDTFLPVLP